MSEQEPRPPQATLAGGLIIGGSVALVATAWERISTLRTLEVQRDLEQWLRDSGLDASMGVDTFSTVLRVSCIVAAAAAVAAAILGVEVFKRSVSARIALTALTPLLLLGGTATAGLFAPLVVLGIALLWARPTRDWYAGRPWIEAERARREARLGALRPPGSPGSPGGSPSTPRGVWPPPLPPTSEATPPSPGLAVPPPPPAGAPAPWAAPPRTGPQARAPRPTPLVLACVLSWVASSITAVTLALTALVVADQSDELYAQVLRDQPLLADRFTERDVVALVYLMIAALVVWCLGAIVLAGLTFVGHNWARITLAVSAITAAVMAAVLVISAPPALLVVVVLASTARLLLRGDVAAWFQQPR